MPVYTIVGLLACIEHVIRHVCMDMDMHVGTQVHMDV
jgi:hypothetical protein